MSAPNFFRPKLAVSVLAVLAITGFGTLGAIRASASSGSSSPAPEPEVDVATVLQRAIVDEQTYSGRLAAVEQVAVRPLVSGTIVAVNIQDGALVKRGDVLFAIDPEPYKAEVDRATGQLAATRSRADYARDDWERAQRLIVDHAIAQRDHDEKRYAAREAAANVEAAQAALTAAKINLAHTRVIAPVSGRVSRAEITLGNVVAAGGSAPALTTIVSVSPVYAEFDADEQTYLQFIRRISQGAKVPVELGLANEHGFSREGQVQSVDNRLNTSSGTIRVRARFENKDGALIPGLYARVRVGSSESRSALLVDDAAVGTDQDKKFVLIVDRQSHVRYREIQIGSLHGSLRVVQSGLRPGDQVVVNGAQRVQPDIKVRTHVVTMENSPPQNNSANTAAST
jgi:multidrug efflux system membrane fusion protein